MKRLRTSIRLKLSVATLVPLMTAIVVCWVIGASIITTRFSSQALQNVSSHLNSAHEIFLSDLSRLSDIIRLTGQSPELAASLSGTTSNSIPTLQTITRNERLSFLTVVDRYGLVRYRAANPGLSGDSRRGDKLIFDALKGAHSSGIVLLSAAQAERENPLLPQAMNLPVKATIHARQYTKKTEERGLFQVSASPVLAPDGNVIAVVYGGVLLNGNSRLVDRITQVLFKKNEADNTVRGNVTMFLDDVRIATSVLDEQGKPAIGTLMSEEVFSSISRGSAWIGSAYVLNSRYFTAYEPLRDLHGDVVGALYVGIPEEPLLQLRTQVNVIFTAVLLFVSMIGVALSAWLGANLSRPIRALEEGARRIASGDNLPDISVDSHDEIALLADEFNAMKRRLQERNTENEALNLTLEQKVLERTTQLEEKSLQLLNTERDLAQSERLAGIGVLASGVAHEINNPLAIIRGNAELLEMSAHLNDSDQSEVETIIKQVGRVERIVSNLLTFARTKKKIIRPFNIEELLDDILEQVSHQIKLNSYHIERRYQASNGAIEGDEDQLRQVFTNLIINGLQAMETGGALSVSTMFAPETGFFSIAIGDNGTGISAAVKEKLFTPFFTTKSRGTGLGLAVSYGIVKDHGGDIRVENEPGQGAMFTVLLPQRQTLQPTKEV
ncbi:MAG: HAMP domain-containing protein [Geobacteraceae bacterium]|nr:HAMP domain-containing protein [Geobacteraceae bacterium]NTW81034.1 HAMP domain-containing protein [Geobacteraceae bacterium]